MSQAISGFVAVLVACILVVHASAVQPAAQPDVNAPDASTAPIDPAKDEMDQLLKLDLEQLSNVPVSDINPVIEGVSKKKENLSDSPSIA